MPGMQNREARMTLMLMLIVFMGIIVWSAAYVLIGIILDCCESIAEWWQFRRGR